MQTRILFFVGIIASAEVLATRAVSEELIYSPWTKLCLSDVCFVAKDARTASDCTQRFGAALTERTGETKKTLRVTVPSSTDHARGVRIAIDQDQPIERPVGGCYANLCGAEIEGGAELIARLKHGNKVVFDAVGTNGPMHFELPLSNFASAYDGPAQAPALFEAQPEKLQEELMAQSEAERQTQCAAN